MSSLIPEENCEMASEDVQEAVRNNTIYRAKYTKIVLENFKSYFGRHEIGPLHKYFTAVVGPNGSGKSNTIDALLFVFGARAKKMRFNNLSELIHNSAHH